MVHHDRGSMTALVKSMLVVFGGLLVAVGLYGGLLYSLGGTKKNVSFKEQNLDHKPALPPKPPTKEQKQDTQHHWAWDHICKWYDALEGAADKGFQFVEEKLKSEPPLDEGYKEPEEDHTAENIEKRIKDREEAEQRRKQEEEDRKRKEKEEKKKKKMEEKKKANGIVDEEEEQDNKVPQDDQNADVILTAVLGNQVNNP